MTPNERNENGAGEGAERDPRLDRLYRETVREEPPARLDAAILAAARREVGARPRAVSARLRAWRVPVSIAAVVVLSVSLVTLVREEGGGQLERPPAVDLYSRSVETAPAPPAAAPEAAKAPARTQAPAAAPAARKDAALNAMSSAKVADEASHRAADASATRSAAPEPRRATAPAAAPSPQPFQGGLDMRERRQALSAEQAAGASAERQTGGVRGSGEESSITPAERGAATGPAARMMQRDMAATGEPAGSLGTARAPAVAAPAAKPGPRAEARAAKSESPQADATRVAALLKEFELQPPEKWLEKIAALKREGRKGEADDMLAEFKRRFPNHPLPPELR